MRCVATGSIHTFEVGMADFHELRYSVALALHECRAVSADEGLRRVAELEAGTGARGSVSKSAN